MATLFSFRARFICLEAVAVILNLRTLDYHRENHSGDFSRGVSLSHIIWWGDNPFVEDVRVNGRVEKQEEGYDIEYSADFSYKVPCGRCLKEVEKRLNQSFKHKLKDIAELEKESDDVISLNRDNLDLTAMMVSDLVSQLPDVVLCMEDCLGLCPICGGNLNKVKCDCKEETITDSRFNVLRELLNKTD